jgi:hypothetical protein
MNLDAVKLQLEERVAELRAIIIDEVESGEEDCQRLTMLNALSAFERTVNGLLPEDLKTTTT